MLYTLQSKFNAIEVVKQLPEILCAMYAIKVVYNNINTDQRLFYMCACVNCRWSVSSVVYIYIYIYAVTVCWRWWSNGGGELVNTTTYWIIQKMYKMVMDRSDSIVTFFLCSLTCFYAHTHTHTVWNKSLKCFRRGVFQRYHAWRRVRTSVQLHVHNSLYWIAI